MVIAPWMWGVGVVAAAGAGIAVYEVTRPKPVAPLLVAVTAPVVAPKPVVTQFTTALRPQPIANALIALSTPNLGLPVGPIVTMVPGTTTGQPGVTSATVLAGQNLTVVLPSGAQKWIAVAWGVSGPPGSPVVNPNGQVTLGNDVTSPITLTLDQLTGSNELVAEWIDSQGTTQGTLVNLSLAKVVVLRP